MYDRLDDIGIPQEPAACSYNNHRESRRTRMRTKVNHFHPHQSQMFICSFHISWHPFLFSICTLAVFLAKSFSPHLSTCPSMHSYIQNPFHLSINIGNKAFVPYKHTKLDSIQGQAQYISVGLMQPSLHTSHISLQHPFSLL